jgi:ubiquitin carboxyl-terminal hydrolase 7
VGEGEIKRLFQGKMCSFVRCRNVTYESKREEEFYDIQLDVKDCPTLEHSFRKYVQLELLDGDNQYDAEAHGKQDADKGVQFLRFPPVLNIQLKRFEFDSLTGFMTKVAATALFLRYLLFQYRHQR